MPTKTATISFPVGVYSKIVTDGPSVTPGTVETQTNGVVTAVRTRTGSRLPKWKSIIRNGGNATTNLTGRFDSVWTSGSKSWSFRDDKASDGSWTTRECRGDVAGVIRSQIGLTVEPLLTSTLADNLARARFYKRLRETQVAFSGPTFLGELRETLRMIKRPASALRDSLDRYHSSLKKWKGRNRPPASGHKLWNWRQELEKVAGGLWLENSFGWQPLLNDVKDAVSAYERLTPPLSNRKIISVGAKVSRDRFKDYQNANRTYDPYFQMTWKGRLFLAQEHANVRYKGSVTISTEATKWDNAALFGFTPSEFIPTAWELLPWSFLIDYFTNIGDILSSAVTQTAPVNFVNKTVRMITAIRAEIFCALSTQVLAPGWKRTTIIDPVVLWGSERKDIIRSVGEGVPLPTFQIESGLNIGQMCNITALLTNFISIHPQSPRTWHR